MNAEPSPESLAPARRHASSAPRVPRPLARRLMDFVLGKSLTIMLTAVALGVGVATFLVLARGQKIAFTSEVGVGAVLANLTILLMLGAVLAGRLTKVWADRRRGSAGSRLHVRMVLLFGGVAVAPTIVLATMAVAFFHFRIESWFNEPVRAALTESLEVSRGYLEEHRDNIRTAALEMANDLTRAGQYLSTDPAAFADVLAEQTALRGLTEAVIYEPLTGQVMASAGMVGGGAALPPAWATERARAGDAVVLGADDANTVQALTQMGSMPPLMLLVGRPVDTAVLDHMVRAETAVSEYQRLDKNRSYLQLAFAWIFLLVALLVLTAAVLIGLVLANSIARPIGGLILAAERVRAGDLSVTVPETATRDEVADLSRAFNRMTGQLAAQRTELMDAYGQIDERRRFTETVLSGVSAGVLGLDVRGRIELPNRAAGEFLGLDPWAAIGRPLADVVPALAPLLAEVQAEPARPRTAEITHRTRGEPRTLLARIGAETLGGAVTGYVVTFDDITDLQAAQRAAAWAGIARRIAHEIKNPLTPIQLAAERLKRRFAREITSDPETFTQCADTIVRHVGDIGRMVDEFSRFARMPTPVMRREDVGLVAREALVLQRTARPDIAWTTAIPASGPFAECDRGLITQALVNLLQNAADAVAMCDRSAKAGTGEGAGAIGVSVSAEGRLVRITVTDDGVGWPATDRALLTEPYVTHKPKGTGLGLAIVKKILEEHRGRLLLEDPPGGAGAAATLLLPQAADAADALAAE